MAIPTVKLQTIDLAPLDFRAELSSFNEGDRTVQVIFSTGAGVERYDWTTGERYIEKLDMAASAVQLDRLNSGAPLLDGHSAWSVGDVLGTVVPGSARVEQGRGLATLKFSSRDNVAPIIRDVKDQILTSVSVGYRVGQYEKTAAKDGQLAVMTAKRWTPFEISLVAMPADVGARVRSGDKTQCTPCVVVAARDASADIDLHLRRRRLALSAA